MQKREKILAGALAGTVVFWFGFSAISDRILKPLQELEGREIQLTEEKDRLFEQQLALARKDAEVKVWRGLSLPPDPLDAQRLYQEWLTTMAQLSGFEINKITLDRRVAEANTYVTIPITIDAKAQLQELALFLERFESVQLLHRISRCDVASPSSEGDPELSVTLTAEGLSLPAAPARQRLFPQTELSAKLPRDARQLVVASQKGFPPKAPFCIRIGSEFLRVTAVDGREWTLQRGVEKSFAEDHDVHAGVEEFPLQAGENSSQAATAIWTKNLFTKPSQQVSYQPRLASTTPPVAIRGRSWTWKPEVAGWNPAFGSPKFELVSAPAGMELNERTGTLNWSVSDRIEKGEQPIEILVWGTNGRNAGFTPVVQVHVRDPNEPPKFEKQAPLRFYIGRESTVKIAAHDPDGADDQLKYSLKNGPSGMSLDATSGELKWAPANDLAPQELTIEIAVTDADTIAETSTESLPVTLEEDSAKYTYLTGSLTRTSGVQEAWIYDRITNRRLVVHVGDRFRIADFDLIVEKIGATFLQLKRNGEEVLWQFEEPLTDIAPTAPAAGAVQSAASPTSNAATPSPEKPAEPASPSPSPDTPQPKGTMPDNTAPDIKEVEATGQDAKPANSPPAK